MASHTAGAGTSYFTPTTRFYLAKSIKIAKFVGFFFFSQRHSCFVSSCFCLETLLAVRCEPHGAEGSAGGQAGVCTARPTPGDLRQEGSGTCFHTKIKTAQEEKHNIAQSDPERQNCNNKKFSPKMQPMRTVIAWLVCPHRGWQEVGEHSFGLGQIFCVQPCGPLSCPLLCWRSLPPSGAPQSLTRSPPGMPGPTKHIQAVGHRPRSLVMSGNNPKLIPTETETWSNSTVD